MNPVLSLAMLLASAQGPSGMERTVVAKGLKHPWSMAFLSAKEALVTEKDGLLQHVDLENGQFRTVQGVPKDLDNVRRGDPRDNSGLFDVVLHSKFSENALVYLSYASKGKGGTTTKVIRGRYETGRLRGVRTILEVEPRSPDRFHYGGGMVFGDDGLLYITVGERLLRESEQPALPIAQDPRDGRGKIYRLTDEGGVPSGNPQFDAKTPPGVFALGIRAAQGLTKQPKTGDIWFSEHGSRQGDELNILRAGANYGWPVVTSGEYRDLEYQPPKLDLAFKPPAWYWVHTVAPTGLCFYQGSLYPEWTGNLFVAGLSQGSLWRFDVRGQNILSAEELFTNDRVRLRNVKEGPNGFLYLLSDEPEGRILRIEPGPPARG